ncbi:dihydroorotate dehydrogenase-like protein [Marinobacteraceae bacterium S3BR75-40.1]
MIDLSTRYLGLDLKNPLVPSSSPLTGDFDMARRLEDAGAAALVLPSLFEEEVVAEQEMLHRFLDQQDIGHAEADTFLPEAGEEYVSHLDRYLERIQRYKAALDIPVIGSLNGVTDEGWLDHARDLEQAGCDALELNVYFVAADADESAAAVEARYLDLLRHVRGTVRIPVTVKLSSQLSSVAYMVKQLEACGAQGVSLFNRFYQPDLDLESLALVPRIHPSSAAESLLRIRWIGLLRPQVGLSLAATGGFQDHRQTLKALLVGADVVQFCHVLLERGPAHLGQVLTDLHRWMEEHEYQSVEQLKGSVCQSHAQNPAEFERANYVDVLDSHTPARGVR